MELERIAELLQPFLSAAPFSDQSSGVGLRATKSALNERQLRQISTYLDLLLRWNSRINLTAVREPQAIVTRHFGESLFLACRLFPPSTPREEGTRSAHPRVLDFGSGAGFPGLPVKIWSPDIELILIESNHKKATFLREVIRALALGDAEAFSGRAEDFRGEDFRGHADVVTLRAVERFESSLPVAAGLVAPNGRLALLIGESQVDRARAIEPTLRWKDPLPIPLSANRVLLLGRKRLR
jgi:16S rRNA (guanine527-N7)-methyltransferase